MAAVAIVLATLLMLWLDARPQKFFVCDMECGETLLAVRAANQFAANGVEFGLLENVGSHDDPLIYTHNVNLGSLTFILMEAMDIHEFRIKTLIPLLAFGAGLFYVYLTVLLFSRSPVLAIITLILFATTYWGLGAYALNPLRAWHLPGFFAISYHVGRMALGTGRRRDRVGLLVGAIIAFACGYDFWAICGAVAVVMVLSQAWRQAGWKVTASHFGFIAVAFAIPFALRQVQVIYALGAAYWWQDMVFSLGIKIPGASKVIRIPSIPEIDAFYHAHHILRPPSSPTNDVFQILATLKHMLQAVTIPRWGILTICTFLLALVIGAASKLIAVKSTDGPRQRMMTCLTQLLLPMSCGIAIGLAVLAPFSLHVYLKHEFPLVAFPLLIGKGLALYGLGVVVVSRWRQSVAYFATAVIAVFLWDAGMVYRNASENGLYPNFEWRHFVLAHPSSRFLISTYGSASWRNANLIEAVDPILGLADANKTYADPADARDVAKVLSDRPTGRSPAFWIYQPTEQTVDFDSLSPTCRWRDWILGSLTDALPRSPIPVKLVAPWITPPRATVGTTVTFGGTLKGHHRGDTIEVSTSPQGPVVRDAAYNCIYQTAIAWVTIDQPIPGNLTIDLASRHAGGRRDVLHRFTTPIDADPPPIAPIAVPRISQPSIAELISLAPNLKVVARDDAGIGYVVFEVPE